VFIGAVATVRPTAKCEQQVTKIKCKKSKRVQPLFLLELN